MSHQYDEKRQPAVRFAFVCRYCQGTPQAKSKDPAFAPIVVALSSKAMAEILGFTRLVESQLETDFWQTQAFVRELAVHPDSRVRAEAARYECQTAETAEVLAQDFSYEVRSNLVQNQQALEILSLDGILAAVGEDPDLQLEAMDTLRLLLAGADQDNYAMRKDKLAGFLKAAQSFPDQMIVSELESIKAQGKDIFLHKPSFVRSSRSLRQRKNLPAASSCGAIECLAGFLKATILAGFDAAKPVIELDADALDYIVDSLEDGPAAEAVLQRLAEHPASSVRASVAQNSLITRRAIDKLVADKAYSVRSALLENEEVLSKCSAQEIVSIIDKDPGLLQSLTWNPFVAQRIYSALEEVFRSSEDPFVQELMADLQELIEDEQDVEDF